MAEYLMLPIVDPVLKFLMILFIILVVPILLNKIKMPALLGLIFAGMIIGPLGLNVMDRDASFDLFGSAGLLFIMFLAGLDTDISEFKKNSKKSSFFGFLTFFFPFVMSIAVSWYFLGLDIIPSVLIGSMIASHTPLTYPIVGKYDIQKNIAVSIALGGTLITNIVSFLIIIFVVGMTGGEVGTSFWIRLSGSVITFAAILAFIFPVVSRWFFKNFQDNVLQFVFVLFMMYLGAFIADVAGIETIIGALFAGMMMNRLIPRTSPLMNRITFVSNSIFIPFFLIGVGMLVSPRTLVSDLDSILAGICMTIVAVISKYLAAFITQKNYGFSVPQRQVLNGLSTAQAASTLAIVIVGHSLGLLSDAILNGSLIMILITCTVAAIHTQMGARQIAMEKATGVDIDTSEMTMAGDRVLISVSNIETVEELVHLSTMVKSPNSRGGLYALNIITNNASSSIDDQKATRILDKATEVAAATDHELNALIRYDVNIVNGITNVIKENKITALVLGIYHKKGISSSFIGKLNEGILAKSNITTLIYKTTQPIATIKRHVIFVPAGAEIEVGFPNWLLKVWNIAKNSGTKLVFYAASNTLNLIAEVRDKYSVPCEFNEFTDWDDFLVLAREFHSDDNLIFVLSRKNGLTYHDYMNRLPDYLNKYFNDNSYILIFPKQIGVNDDQNDDKIEDVNNSLNYLFNKRLG